jgi:hypothetical protein
MNVGGPNSQPGGHGGGGSVPRTSFFSLSAGCLFGASFFARRSIRCAKARTDLSATVGKISGSRHAAVWDPQPGREENANH